MKIPNEIIFVGSRKTKKSPSHNDKFYFICIMAQALKLLDSISSLYIWIVPSSNSPHRSWFIASIALCGIFKIAIRPPRAIYTNIACEFNVRASVRLAHDRDHCDAGGSAYWFGF